MKECYSVISLTTVNDEFNEISVLGYFSSEEKALNCLKDEEICAKENGYSFEWIDEYTVQLTEFYVPGTVIKIFIDFGVID